MHNTTAQTEIVDIVVVAIS